MVSCRKSASPKPRASWASVTTPSGAGPRTGRSRPSRTTPAGWPWTGWNSPTSPATRHSCPRTPPGVGSSARNRFVGLVTGITADKVMAQVELQCGPFRVVSLMSSEAVRELGPGTRLRGHRRRQGHHRHHRNTTGKEHHMSIPRVRISRPAGRRRPCRRTGRLRCLEYRHRHCPTWHNPERQFDGGRRQRRPEAVRHRDRVRRRIAEGDVHQARPRSSRPQTRAPRSH